MIVSDLALVFYILLCDPRLLHPFTDGKKPRTYRIVAKKQYNGFSKSRKKTSRSIKRTRRQRLNYLRRNLKHIDTVIQNIHAASGTDRG